MTRMQIMRRGLVAGLAAGALAPATASATHYDCDGGGLKTEAACAVRYFGDHHVDPVLQNVDPVVKRVEQLIADAQTLADSVLCFTFGLHCS